MDIRQAIAKCPILDGANPATKAQIATTGIIRKYNKNEIIFREREEVQTFYFIIKGHIALYKTNYNDDRRVIFVYGDGELLNDVILEGSVASISCMALQDIEVLCFPRKHFLEIVKSDPEFSMEIIRSEAAKIRKLYRQMSHTSNTVVLDQSVSVRLWKMGRDHGEALLVRQVGDIYETMPATDENAMIAAEQNAGTGQSANVPQAWHIETRIDFDMSVTFLADMVGSKRESVSRVVSKLTKSGYIHQFKGHFFVIDMEGLREVGRGHIKL